VHQETKALTEQGIIHRMKRWTMLLFGDGDWLVSLERKDPCICLDWSVNTT
jgi:hypothetical protein